MNTNIAYTTYHNGTKYICIAPGGVACVWDPDYWQKVDGAEGNS